MSCLLEIAAFNLHAARAAAAAGAHRIELCDNAHEGGTTPSPGTLKALRQEIHIPVFPIIRPRGGHFVYSLQEWDAMKWDLEYCQSLGFPGVVLGGLNSRGEVDYTNMLALMRLCEGMEVTFHRAFDRCLEAENAIECIIQLGCKRILSSGGFPTVPQGMHRLSGWIQKYQDRITIMPGSGVNSQNIQEIHAMCGAKEYHTAARKLSSGQTTFYNPADMQEEPLYTSVDEQEIQRLIKLLENFHE